MQRMRVAPCLGTKHHVLCSLRATHGAQARLPAAFAPRDARVAAGRANGPDGTDHAAARQPTDGAPQQPDCADLRKKETGRAGRPVGVRACSEPVPNL
jgi:hypothetical protein